MFLGTDKNYFHFIDRRNVAETDSIYFHLTDQVSFSKLVIIVSILPTKAFLLCFTTDQSIFVKADGNYFYFTDQRIIVESDDHYTDHLYFYRRPIKKVEGRGGATPVEIAKTQYIITLRLDFPKHLRSS